MNKLKNLIFVIIFFILSETYVFSKEFIGVISAGIGDIINQDSEKLSTGSKIYFGDTIIIKEKSSAQILLLDETAITVGEKSELTIDDFVYDPESQVGKIVSNIKTGTVRIMTGKISNQNPDNLIVKVPAGVVGSRGTEFVVVTDSDEKSAVILLGPGPDNTLGMTPGSINLSDGTNNIDITQPGFQSIVYK